MNKLVGLSMCIVMAAGLLSGCGKNTPEGKTQQGSAQTGGNAADAGGETTGEPYRFTASTVRWGDVGEAFLDGFVAETEKNANVEIDWQVYVYGEWTEQKPLILAGGELPDVFWGSLGINDSDITQNLAAFIPLEDLIEENMPNLMAAFESEPEMRAIVTSSDGHIYSLPKKLPCRPLTGNQMFINQKWLDNLGLAMPDTWEDYYNVLKAFKEQDANENGDPDDEIPYGTGNINSTLFFTMPFGTTAGADDNVTYMMTVRNGEPVFMPTMESYRDGIAWMSKCYQEGLIDQELYTQDGTMQDAKNQNADAALVGSAAGWTPGGLFGPNALEYAPMPALKGPDGERYVQSDPMHMNYGRNELLITTSCKDPAAVLRWADQYYTGEASIQTFYGSLGLAIDKNDDGTYTVLDPPEGQSADGFVWQYSFRDCGPKYSPEGFDDLVTLPENDGDGLKLKLAADLKPYAKEAYPCVNYTIEQLQSLANLWTDISSYVSSMQAHWVVEGGVEEEWGTYLDTLKQMGLDDFLQIQKDAYETYKTAMK